LPGDEAALQHGSGGGFVYIRYGLRAVVDDADADDQIAIRGSLQLAAKSGGRPGLYGRQARWGGWRRRERHSSDLLTEWLREIQDVENVLRCAAGALRAN